MEKTTSLGCSDVAKLASRGAQRYAINVVLTSDDVAVEGFCASRCGTHDSSPRSISGRFAYVWVGNSANQCPGQCGGRSTSRSTGPSPRRKELGKVKKVEKGDHFGSRKSFLWNCKSSLRE